MRVLFLTQGSSLDTFYRLAQTMAAEQGLERAGFFVTDSRHFQESFLPAHPEFAGLDWPVLKEWELYQAALSQAADPTVLAGLEQRLGAPHLWDAMVADRRIYLGPKAVFTQDYAPRWSHEQMLSILQQTATGLERLCDELRPDMVVSFICVTAADYLGWRVAAARGIPYLNLRPTRIQNYFYAGESPLEPSGWLWAEYERRLAAGGHEPEAAAYLDQARGGSARYEGVIPPSAKPMEQALGAGAQPGIKERLGRAWGQWRDYQAKYQADPSVPPLASQTWYRRVVKPLRARMLDCKLRGAYARPEDLPENGFAFFPLHKEPEVTLLVYSRPYLNQIEACRLIAASLPLGMPLVVKEHPGGVGTRKPGYYAKLRAIPNLVLAPPDVDARRYLERAALCAVIAGSVGFEALLLQKPVITLGNAPFNCLPDSMLRQADRPLELSAQVAGLLAGHRHDEAALLAYLGAMMDASLPLDWYSLMLGRQGVHVVGAQGDDRQARRREQLSALGAYLPRRANELGPAE
ncbi:MAG: hypothetical protein K9K66_00105 [Desulfarculaceae bacterium]|nr:hypothetical protein [Desulfarculaceae bacterium]MCF8072113.1 hypothetical protein [Desulfarculaceae bacterium]MCF8100034.1 hypothetical protein [Desulfarculaceae bacterium]